MLSRDIPKAPIIKNFGPNSPRIVAKPSGMAKPSAATPLPMTQAKPSTTAEPSATKPSQKTQAEPSGTNPSQKAQEGKEL
mmetsp:Transcript_62049/g.122704  ORF Transcript_62049/g.122704 Transcript_62049/m.122704 type:complete len:80 (-) Transcript_62049:136-375(-)